MNDRADYIGTSTATIIRFYALVDLSRGPDGCWPCMAIASLAYQRRKRATA